MSTSTKLPAMIAVESSNIESIGYARLRKELFIQFKKNALYRYSPITPAQWKSFSEAESKGEWVHANLRNNKDISYEKI